MKTLYTIAIDGDIGYFDTWSTKEAAETEAAKWRAAQPKYTYTVEEEEPEQAAYARQTNSVRTA